MGRLINKEGGQPDPKSVRVVLKWEVPRNKRELQSFLGFANYYREFTKFIAVMQWTPECQRAFEILKTLLCSAPILSMPTEDGCFYLDTDASEVAIAAILEQEQEINGGKKLRVIAYGSRILSNAEMRYGAPTAEMLAVVYFREVSLTPSRKTIYP